MAGLPPYQFLPPGHPAWAQAMIAQQQAAQHAQLAQAQAQAQAQAAVQAQAQAAAYAAAAAGAPLQGPGHAAMPPPPGELTSQIFLLKLGI